MKKQEQAKVIRETKKLKKKFMKEVNIELKTLSKLEGNEFQKAVIEHLRDLYKGIQDNMIAIVSEFMQTMNWVEKQDLEVVKFVGGLHKEPDKAIFGLHDRIKALEAFLLFSTVKNFNHVEGELMGHKRTKELAAMLSIDWDGTIQELVGGKKKESNVVPMV